MQDPPSPRFHLPQIVDDPVRLLLFPAVPAFQVEQIAGLTEDARVARAPLDVHRTVADIDHAVVTLVDQPAGLRQECLSDPAPFFTSVLTDESHRTIMIHVIQRQLQQNHFLNLRGHNAKLIALCFPDLSSKIDRSVHRLDQIGVRGRGCAHDIL